MYEIIPVKHLNETYLSAACNKSNNNNNNNNKVMCARLPHTKRADYARYYSTHTHTHTHTHERHIHMRGMNNNQKNKHKLLASISVLWRLFTFIITSQSIFNFTMK